MSATEINYDELKLCCGKPLEWWFRKYGHVTGKNGRHIYIKNGGPILAVAHLDTVCSKSFHFNHYTRNGVDVVKTPTLDDRLGVYTILYLLPSLLGSGWADILLTEGEESGRSTAQDFATDAQYNWIVEFDRRETSLTGGDDVVLYAYNDIETKKLLEENDFKVGIGSVSDISYMEDMGIKAFNFAVGYREYHSPKAWFMPAEYEHNIRKFVNFYNKLKDTKMPHQKKTYQHYTNNRSSWEHTKYNDSLSGYVVYHYGTAKHWRVVFSNDYGLSITDNKGTALWVRHHEVAISKWVCTRCLKFTQAMFYANGVYVCNKCYLESKACLNCGEPFMPNKDKDVCDLCVAEAFVDKGDVIQYIKGRGVPWIVKNVSPLLLTLVTEDDIEIILNRVDYPDWVFRYVGNIGES